MLKTVENSFDCEVAYDKYAPIPDEVPENFGISGFIPTYRKADILDTALEPIDQEIEIILEVIKDEENSGRPAGQDKLSVSPFVEGLYADLDSRRAEASWLRKLYPDPENVLGSYLISMAIRGKIR